MREPGAPGQGTPEAPRCGFSRRVCDALDAAGVRFATFDILADEEVRQGLKAHSQWPTYPQARALRSAAMLPVATCLPAARRPTRRGG